MKIKICGLFREEDIDYVNEAGPDYVGFVFAESRRKITIEQAKAWKQKLRTDIAVVGVFVDAQIDWVNSLVKENLIQLVQLHGKEDDNYISQVKAPTIKAIRMGDRIPENADYILFDGLHPGSGEIYDWSLLPKTHKPFFIAGGVSADNVHIAAGLNPYGIDLSSGVETNGVKDRNKILEIVRRVRNV